jgi:hypothetical protein
VSHDPDVAEPAEWRLSCHKTSLHFPFVLLHFSVRRMKNACTPLLLLSVRLRYIAGYQR